MTQDPLTVLRRHRPYRPNMPRTEQDYERALRQVAALVEAAVRAEGKLHAEYHRYRHCPDHESFAEGERLADALAPFRKAHDA